MQEIRVHNSYDQLYQELVARLNNEEAGKTLVSFASEDALRRTRHYLLGRAAEEGLLLYEEPIPGTLDCEFYLDHDFEE